MNCHIDSDDKPKDNCGIFGVFDNDNAVEIGHDGIRALQHRGENSWGGAATEEDVIHAYRQMGLISRKRPNIKGRSAIFHTRYATAGSVEIGNCQPIVMAEEVKGDRTKKISRLEDYTGNPIAGAHNGNLTGGIQKKKKGSDTRQLMERIKDPSEETLAHVVEALRSVKGAYAILFLTPEMMIGARDPEGYRPLTLGYVNGSYVFSSETSAIEKVGGRIVRNVGPGEALAITKKGQFSKYVGHADKLFECLFELVYLAKQNSVVFNQSVYDFRYGCGKQLARENTGDKNIADIVVGLPSAADIAAVAYAYGSGIQYVPAVFRNHYTGVGRVFIQPNQVSRDAAIMEKLEVIKDAVYGKRVVVVDDSIVSGTNLKTGVKLLFDAGATEVHVRSASPPYLNPCRWGVDTPSVSRFIAHNRDNVKIAKKIGATSVAYLSIQGMLAQTSGPYDKCTKCFKGK